MFGLFIFLLELCRSMTTSSLVYTYIRSSNWIHYYLTNI